MASIRDRAEDMAKEAEGNWKKFQSFGWSRDSKPADAERWAIVYTHNRDSGLAALSNASVIDAKMSEFCTGEDGADCQAESHNHWACGWVDGYAIKVRGDGGELTPAWLAWCELQCALADYPLLDDSDYSDRQYEAAIEAIGIEGRRMVRDDAPEDWESEVYSWLSENEPSELEDDGQDQGAYPSTDSVREALEFLGYLDSDE